MEPENENPVVENPVVEPVNQPVTPKSTEHVETETERLLKKANYEAASNRAALEKATKDFEEFKAKTQEQISSLEAGKQKEIAALQLKVQLAGKVIDVDKALKLVSDEDYTDGVFSPEKFLASNPFMAAEKITTPANNLPRNKQVDVENMSQEDLASNWDKLLNKK